MMLLLHLQWTLLCVFMLIVVSDVKTTLTIANV